jgi:hypothetical protein
VVPEDTDVLFVFLFSALEERQKADVDRFVHVFSLTLLLSFVRVL